jgi:hypothetical protein
MKKKKPINVVFSASKFTALFGFLSIALSSIIDALSQDQLSVVIFQLNGADVTLLQILQWGIYATGVVAYNLRVHFGKGSDADIKDPRPTVAELKNTTPEAVKEKTPSDKIEIENKDGYKLVLKK